MFSLVNGCKQGAILSGILYNFYVNGLFKKLIELKFGCWVDLPYVGLMGYATDFWHHAWIRFTCEKYNDEHGFRFRTDQKPSKSKTKCIAFLQSEREL